MATATEEKTITVAADNRILAAGVMGRDGWRTGGEYVPAGDYRIVRPSGWFYVIQDVGEMAGDVWGTYYYVNRRDVIGLL